MPPISRKLASEVAFILDEASIPNMVFGWIGLTLAGSNFGIREVEFVIPDAYIDAAVTALVKAGYDFLCQHPECPELRVDRDQGREDANADAMLQIDRFHAVEAAHFHLDNWGYLLSLHKKSEVLWWLDDRDLALSTDYQGHLAQGDHPDLILSNDTSRIPPFLPSTDVTGSGPWVGLYPVRTLNPHSYTGAIMLLVCRNMGHVERLDRMWGSILVALKDEGSNSRCRNRGIVFKMVRPLFKPAWEWFNHRPQHGDKPGLMGLVRLREELKARGLLGGLPLPEMRDIEMKE
ncbi:hypothetical protein BDV06DRAFT_226915 [Aspergillus oleicola]